MKHTRWTIALLLVALIAASCGRSSRKNEAGASTTAVGGASAPANCTKGPLKATDVGITADTITIQVMADVGSPLAPGLFQSNIDSVKGYADYINKAGGIACRRLVVRTFDSKLSAEESKNGIIDGCSNAFAMVGGNSLFNPDMTAMVGCADKDGAKTGLPDIAASAVDINELCNATTYTIQPVFEKCPVAVGKVRPLTTAVGSALWHLSVTPGLHGLFLVPGDLPTTVQAATFQIKALSQAGLVFDATPKVSSRAQQSEFTPVIQFMKHYEVNFVQNGANDSVMLKVRREAKAQGYDGVKVWNCGSCYTKAFLAGGADAEGTYVDLPFLPFEERSQNKALAAFLDAVGPDKADNFGAQAWQAAMLFKRSVDDLVATDGPNGLTRAKLLDALAHVKSFDADGWLGKKDLRGASQCFMTVQVQGGKFVRVHPSQPGTFDCKASNVATVMLDPAAEAAKLK